MNNRLQNVSKYVQNKLPWVAWFVYFILIIVYAKERISFSDSAGFLFDLINNQKLIIPNDRYISAITQILPILFIKWKLSLNIVVIAYSFSFFFIHFLCFFLIYKIIKNKELGISLLLLHLCFVHYSFYWPLSEIVLGISFLFLWISILNKPNVEMNKVLFIFIGIIGSSLILWIHPYIFILAIMMLMINCVQRREKRYIIIVISTLFFCCLQLYLMKTNQYEHDKVKGISKVSIKSIYAVFNSITTMFFFKELVSSWFFGFLIYLITLIHAITRKDKKFVLITVFSFILLLFINNQYMPVGGGLEYMETYFLLIFAVWCMCCIIYWNDILKKKLQTYITIVLSIAILQFVFIHISEKWHKNRIKYLLSICDEKTKENCYKVIIKSEKINNEQIGHSNWSLPYESILLSSLKNNRKSSVLYLDFGQIDYKEKNLQDMMLGVQWWQFHPYNEMNLYYFKLPTQDYCNF